MRKHGGALVVETSPEYAQVVMERDAWEAIARERQGALDKLQADRSHASIQSALQFARLAWTLMLVTLLFAGTIIVAGAVRAARTAPAPCVPPAPLERS